MITKGRRNFMRQALGAGFGLGLGVPGALASSNTQRITILHTNDLHSRIEPFAMDSGPYANTGGLARRATLIKKIRDEEPNLLLLDAGDIFQGSPYFNLFRGELELKLMSQMKYDAATLGEHDFALGLKGLVRQMEYAAFPFLVANYDFSATGFKDYFAPFKIFEQGGIKIGVFGLGVKLEGLINEKLYGATKYLDPVGIAREICQELRSLECDIIVCLSHLGHEYDTDQVSDVGLAQKVNGIDLIIGGHTHTSLEELVTVRAPDGQPVMINQVGWGGINMGRIDMKFQKENRQLLFKSKTQRIDQKSITN